MPRRRADPMSSLTLPLLKSISAIATDKPLSDPSMPASPIPFGLPARSSTVSIPDPAGAGGSFGSFVISEGAETSFAILNSGNDPDPIGYFNLGSVGQPAAENPAEAPII